MNEFSFLCEFDHFPLPFEFQRFSSFKTADLLTGSLVVKSS